MRRLIALFMTVSLFISAHSRADVILQNIHDGDSLTVLDNGTKVKLRLIDIDAPELKQPFGQGSKKALVYLCEGKSIRYTAVGQDRYKRTLAKVYCNEVFVNERLVVMGLAWSYRNQNEEFNALQAEAMAKHRGLWGSRNPVSPWEYRKNAK